MTTVASRTFRSTPNRDAAQTWRAIVDLLTQGRTIQATTELIAVTGIAASVIADQAPQSAPIVVTCDGPRTRIYCVYDDDAIDDSEADESVLGFDPLKGDWHLSLPCSAEDLDWVQAALEKHGTRVTARDLATNLSEDAKANTKVQALVIDPKGFLNL